MVIFVNKAFNFSKINRYDTYIININKRDYEKMQECIYNLTKKYNYRIKKFYEIEKTNTKQFEFNNQIKFIISHKKLLINIINDVLKIYKEELKNTNVVFLSGSFARGTNKMSSDMDLHFFYKNDNYNYVYEEIISYIISRVINKSRDCIDPTFIFNIQNENKIMITSKMDKSKLRVILKYKNKEIKYSYKKGKKRRFYLQYTNTRDINKLFNYLSIEIGKNNEEWCHCFEVIKGKKLFNKLYDKIYNQEQNLINNNYISNKINVLKETIKVSRNNIINYVSKACDLIRPLYDKYSEIIKSTDIVHGDETRLKVLSEKNEEGNVKTNYVWLFRTSQSFNKQITFYYYNDGRKYSILMISRRTLVTLVV